jgi:hypothetical protein
VLSLTNPLVLSSNSEHSPSCVLKLFPPHNHRSYFTTDGQSVSLSWCRAHSGTCNQILLPVRMLLSKTCRLVSVGCSLFLKRGRVCNLQCSNSMVRVMKNP